MSDAAAIAQPDIVDVITERVEPRLFDPAALSVLPEGALPLAKRFIMPPFSILDVRRGEWQARKAAWEALGLRSEVGRFARVYGGGKSITEDEWLVDPDTGLEYLKGAPPGSVMSQMLAVSNGVSIFDPVLCELMYLWHCPPGGRILDPYAGGSVRGLVASILGRYYTGIDLSPIQIEANNEQADDMLARGLLPPEALPDWVVADSWRALYAEAPHDREQAMVSPGPYDLIFTCPPYADLEHYSDDPDDLSNMPWPEFKRRYAETIMGAVDRLANNRFAIYVVGEIREKVKPGVYRNFMGATIDAFEAAGAAYYNEYILIAPVGTLRLRAAKQFVTSRKNGRMHQTVLVFCKGDPFAAAEACTQNDALEAAVQRPLEQVLAADDVEGADDVSRVAVGTGIQF